MGLFSGGNSRTEAITDASGIQSGGSVQRLEESTIDNSYSDSSSVINTTEIVDASKTSTSTAIDNSYSDSSTTTTNNTFTDNSQTQNNTASGAGSISTAGDVTILSADAEISRNAFTAAENIISAQLLGQRQYNELAMGAQREFQALAMGDLNASRSVMLADAERARQTDGGKSEKIILYALAAVAALGIAFAWAGAKK